MEKGEALELMAACMTRNMKGLTAKVSGPQNAGPLDRRVRPEGQKGAHGLGQGRSPRKSAGPRKRRSAARMIAGGAWLASAGGQKGLKTPWTTQSAGIGDCAHEAGDGPNALSSAAAVGGRLRRIVSPNGLIYLHHCCSHGTPSLFPSIFVPGQFLRKKVASSQEVI